MQATSRTVEWLGGSVVLVDEAIDRGLKVDDGMEDAALQASARELGQEALDRVQPRAGCRRAPVGCDRRLARRSCPVFQQAVDAGLHEPLLPAPDACLRLPDAKTIWLFREHLMVLDGAMNGEAFIAYVE